MAVWYRPAICAVTAIWLVLVAQGVNASRRTLGSKAPIDTPSLFLSEYTVPTQGGFLLVHLALARGNLSYSCHHRKRSQPPIYLSQFTTLWDAAPLIPHIADENQFHTIIPQLFEFNYAEIANSSLTCIGTISTIQGQPVANLFQSGVLSLNIQQTIQGPGQGSTQLDWAYEVSDDQMWEVYRVETISDTIPNTCEDEHDDFSLNYAAEYWFFHN